MEQAKLQKILQAHKKWLAGDYKEGARADLRDADLHGADLCDADLRAADLHGADLSGADLSGAELSGAHMFDANLRNADLRNANLCGANLCGADLRGANMFGANLCGANLRYANLCGAGLRGADLRGANLDFSCFPLWCGGLNMHIDDRLARQLLYHLLRNVAYSKNTSDEMKSLLFTPELISAANQFHRVDECGRIAQQEVTT